MYTHIVSYWKSTKFGMVNVSFRTTADAVEVHRKNLASAKDLTIKTI